ncbi:restriction endonuclease subunit S [Enterococcus faecium]|uniref:restriction endonuclease subunit S n=1 Tax=Enterococcus faecium TaxID=1352 RepID=UPI001EE8A2C8|nr:restriction endonuclease subunit S [Enterococcus faecium]
MSNNRQPEIRFPGFTEDWEQRKLSDIADKAVDNRGKTPTISEDGNHPLLEVASLGNGAPDYSKVTKYLSDETFMAELRAYIKEGDILFSTVGSIGLVSLMDTNENAAIAQNIVAFRANEKYDSKFLYAMLSTKDNQHKAQRIVMGAVQPSIKVSQLVDVDYCVTENMEEQRKLGEYFLNLDNLITLHQRKLDLLKETKKGFLQKMFPKNGAKVPEIRFPGFTDDWEQRRLKQLGEIQTGNTPPTNDTENYNKNGIMWVTPTDINNLVISDTAKKLSEIGRLKARIAMKGSILVTCIASIGKNTLALSDVGFNQQINALTPNKEFDSYFLLSQSGKWSEKMKILAGRGTMQIVNKTDFSNITTYVPKYREQVKIGHFFKQLDDTIALHQRKLDLLKETKKGFLQKMFV